MTAIVALEAGEGRLDEIVTVSKKAAQLGGSTMRLRTGDQYTLEELLTGLLLRSGNDASVAIAEHLAGSTEAFVALMNEKALALGATSTRFANPHGLDHPDHYTTPYDLALITRHAMGKPLFAQLVATRERRVDKEQQPDSWMLNNTNRLLWSYEAADGVKTGTTGQAGNCLVATATRDGQQLIAVVMNAGDRWTDSTKLLDWGFDQYDLVRHAPAGQEIGAAPLLRGKTKEVRLRLGEDVTVVVPRKAVAMLRTEIEVHGTPEAPVYEGQPLGTMYVYAGELLVGDAPLVAAETVRRRGLWPWLQALFGFGP
jgi:D-alanyl-D-alanine carboxypeptidase (penicillin-binding protein 5/6)